MTLLYFDSSAIVKRYLVESGTPWVRQLCDPAARNAIVVSGLTMVEVAAAFAARHRAPGGMSRQARDAALQLFLQHLEDNYIPIDADRTILFSAVALTQRHRLRGYDAVQLATALTASRKFGTAALPGLLFVAADVALLTAARAEGLTADDPSAHA